MCLWLLSWICHINQLFFFLIRSRILNLLLLLCFINYIGQYNMCLKIVIMFDFHFWVELLSIVSLQKPISNIILIAEQVNSKESEKLDWLFIVNDYMEKMIMPRINNLNIGISDVKYWRNSIIITLQLLNPLGCVSKWLK